jgi:hypothetical protein
MAFLSTVMLRCATNPFLLSPDQLYCERPLRTSFGLDCHDTDQANLNFSTRYVYGAGSGRNESPAIVPSIIIIIVDHHRRRVALR